MPTGSIDVAINPAPTSTAAVLDPRWLAATVYRDHPGIRITGVEIVETLVTTATKLRATVHIESPPAGIVTNVCIKGMLDDAGAPYVSSGIAKTEARFYAEGAPQLAARAMMIPHCLHAGIDPANDHGLIVMEDLVARGARFLSALTPYTPEEAAASLEQMARLHATSWDGRTTFALPWLARTIEAIAARSLIPLDLLQQLMDGPRGTPLPRAILDAGRLHRAIGSIAQRFGRQPGCLVHGDAHAGNLYQLDGAIGLIDWQLAQRGHWALDVAYHLAAALTPEDRRTGEAALLDHYLDRLAAFGGPRMVREEAWDDYRAAMLYAYYLWSITRRVDPVITHEFVRRIGTAVTDLDSFAVAEAAD